MRQTAWARTLGSESPTRRHSTVAANACYRASVILLLALAATTALSAQVTIGLGGSFQHLFLDRQSYEVSGYSFDLSVRLAPPVDFTTRFQRVGYDGSAERDPIHVTSLEVGVQYVISRGRPLQLGLGFGVGAHAQDQYDAGGAGANLMGHARVMFWPAREVGVFAEGTGRVLGGGVDGTSMGLTFGILLGLNH